MVKCLSSYPPGVAITKQMFLSYLYSNSVDAPEPKIVDVFMCKVRKKLKDQGYDVITEWGRGYMLSAESHAKVSQIREAARQSYLAATEVEIKKHQEVLEAERAAYTVGCKMEAA
jgi:DNA-binding winged helix-turn-helix (wHTH) protein